MSSGPKRAMLVLFALSPFLSAPPAGPGDLGHGPCRRTAPRTFERGEIVEIPDTEAPCRVVVRETGVRLLGVEDGSRPDPGTKVVRDRRGRFYSAGARGFRATIALWDEEGNFLKSFGRTGEGPGEFNARGILSIFLDDEDRLHVHDGAPRWSVFSPDLEFLGSVPGVIVGSSPDLAAILDDGMMLVSHQAGGDRVHYFRTVDSTGARHRSFGVIPDGLRRARVDLERTIAYSGGESFWAAPVRGGPDGYQLEEWGLDGELRRGFRRAVDWFRPSDPESLSPDDPPPMQVDALHIDDSGLLYVFMFGANDKWRSLDPRRREPTDEEIDEMSDLFVEVIDARSGKLLASERGYTVSQAVALFPRRFFRGSKEGYRIKRGGEPKSVKDLLPTVEIVSVDLEGK